MTFKTQLNQWRPGKFSLLALFFLITLKSSGPTARQADLLLPTTKNDSAPTLKESPIASSESQFDYALYDLDKRIDPVFATPVEYLPRVEFWLKIYTKYTSRNIVLFDENHPNVQYEVLDLAPIEARSRNAIVFEILTERFVQAKIKEYKQALLLLHKKRSRPKHISEFVWANVQRAKQEIGHGHTYRDLEDSFRTQLGQSDFVGEGITRITPWLPTIERVFQDHDLPPQLTRISLVESSFNPIATSWAGARGAWQFMEATAREYLRLDPRLKLDERISVYKSTIAAAKLFKRHRKMLKDWPRTVTSYNHGLRTFIKSKDGAHSSLSSLCGRASKLGFASRNYYSEFLAMLRAEQYRELFFVKPQATEPFKLTLLNPTLIKTPHPMTFNELFTKLERSMDLTLEQFTFLNPDLSRTSGKLPKLTRVVVPLRDGTEDSLPSQQAAPVRRKLKKSSLLTAQNGQSVGNAVN